MAVPKTYYYSFIHRTCYFKENSYCYFITLDLCQEAASTCDNTVQTWLPINMVFKVTQSNPLWVQAWNMCSFEVFYVDWRKMWQKLQEGSNHTLLTWHLSGESEENHEDSTGTAWMPATPLNY